MLLPEGVEPFVVLRPARDATPVIVEIPHAGFAFDAASLAYTCAPLRGVGRDADMFVDRLFHGAEGWGASVLVSRMSRLIVDLNRGPDDVDSLAVDGFSGKAFPRGLIWRTTTEGDPVLTQRLPRAEFDRRMDVLYRPYHRALRELIDEKLAAFGVAILLCAHSMPSQGRRGHVDVGAGRADIVPGTRGRTTASDSVIGAVDEVIGDFGFSVKHDDPYRGGFSTGYYGRPKEHVHAIQIEIARRLYMDEEALTLTTGASRVSAFAKALVERLGSIA